MAGRSPSSLLAVLGVVASATGGCDRALTQGMIEVGPDQDGGGPGSSSDAGATPTSTCPGATPGTIHYRLVQTRNVASPVPDPTGIASDGSSFWILSGGHNSQTNTLVHFDPETLVTDRTFRFQNLIENPGTGAYGVTWDGAAVWIVVSGNTNKLVRVDPTNGQITRTMSAPTDLGPSDLDFDGSDLWLSSGTGSLFSIDRATGGILRRFATSAASSGRDNGVAFRPGELWVGDLFGGVEVHDPATGNLIATATHEDGCAFAQEEMGSSCFVGCDLVIASSFGITTYRPQAVP